MKLQDTKKALKIWFIIENIVSKMKFLVSNLKVLVKIQNDSGFAKSFDKVQINQLLTKMIWLKSKTGSRL